MNHGIIWCSHCRQPQPLGTKICPGCARSFDRRMQKGPRHDLEGVTLGGKWVIKGLIGSGGVGDVFEAENTQLRRTAAVKVVRVASEQAAQRLEREALLVAAARHPNICDVYDVGRLEDGRPYLVLERLYGETLSTIIRNAHATMPLALIIDLFTQLLSAIHAAHGAQIVHRDLSPKNIFLVDRLGLPPVLKVVDFGFAKDLSGVRSSVRTGAHTRVGTFAYMSPEQLRGEPLDRRSDIFAIGVMLHEMLTGRHPFAATSFLEFQANILQRNPVSIAQIRADVPPRGADVVAIALAKDVARRWPDALMMQRELQRAFMTAIPYQSMRPPPRSR